MDLAGRRPTVAVWVILLTSVVKMKIKFLLFAIPSVQLATLELDQCVTKTAQRTIQTSWLSATSQRDMVVEPVRSNSAKAARSGASCGIPSAEKVSTRLLAACANQSVQRAWLILVLRATRKLSAEDLATHFSAGQTKTRSSSSAIRNAQAEHGVLDQFAGATALQEQPSAEPSVSPKGKLAQIC